MLVRPRNLSRTPPATPATAATERAQPARSSSSKDAVKAALFSDHPSLAEAAATPSVASHLRERGWVVLPLNADEAALVERAGDAAERALDADAPLEQLLRHLERKTILSVRPTPLHGLLDTLRGSAHAMLGGVARDLALPHDFFEPLLEEEAAAAPETTLSAMRYHRGDGGGCDDHVDRGLLTLVTGQVDALEVYDRVEGRWIAPPRPPSCDAWVVAMVGATLFRATAGLVPAKRSELDGGPLRHRVQPTTTTSSSSSSSSSTTTTGAATAARQSLVLRLRAPPAATFACAPLRGRPNVVARFVDGVESVSSFIAAQNFTSVNEERPAAAATAAKLPDNDVAEAVEAAFDEAAARCGSAGILSDAELDRMTDVVAAAPAAERTAALLGQLQSLVVAEWLAQKRQPRKPKTAAAAAAATAPAAAAATTEKPRPRTPAETRLEAALCGRADLRPACAQLLALLPAASAEAAPAASPASPAPATPPAPPAPFVFKAEAAPKPPAEPINFRVVDVHDGSETFFKCKRDTPLERMMNAWCNRQGVTLDKVRFVFDGRPIDARQTPDELAMEDGDAVDVEQDEDAFLDDFIDGLDSEGEEQEEQEDDEDDEDGIEEEDDDEDDDLPPYDFLDDELEQLQLQLGYDLPEDFDDWEAEDREDEVTRMRAELVDRISTDPAERAEVQRRVEARQAATRAREEEMQRRMAARQADMQRMQQEERRRREAFEAEQRLMKQVRQHLSNARRLAIRAEADANFAMLATQMGDDAAHLTRQHAAAREMQIAARAALAVLRAKINLKVVTQDGNEIYFKVRRNVRLQTLMHAFCNRQGVTMGSVRFLFDGNRINDMQTPSQLEMEDGDIIDVMVEQMGD